MIRKARISDAPQIAKLMMLAMKEVISKLTGSENASSELPFLERFISMRNNQYSFENTLVFENNNHVCGSLTAYDGAQLHALRQPILDYLRLLEIEVPNIDDETAPGEFYIDTISVSPKEQRTGKGAQLLKAGIEYGLRSGHRQIGLLVNPENQRAKEFYQRMGFKPHGIRRFLNIDYIHMVCIADELAEK